MVLILGDVPNDPADCTDLVIFKCTINGVSIGDFDLFTRNLNLFVSIENWIVALIEVRILLLQKDVHRPRIESHDV